MSGGAGIFCVPCMILLLASSMHVQEPLAGGIKTLQKASRVEHLHCGESAVDQHVAHKKLHNSVQVCILMPPLYRG